MFKVEKGILKELATEIEKQLIKTNDKLPLTTAMKSCIESYELDGFESICHIIFDIMDFVREIDDLDSTQTDEVRIIRKDCKLSEDKYFVTGILRSDNFLRVKNKVFKFYIPINLDILTTNRNIIHETIEESLCYLDAKYISRCMTKNDSRYNIVDNSITETDAIVEFVYETELFENADYDVISLVVLKEHN